MSHPGSSPTEIDPLTALDRIADGAVLVDVREADEVAQAAYDVPNMVMLPLSELPARYEELPRDKELVMACRSGGRSARAMQFLLDNGYEQVVNLSGGIMRWQSEERPMRGRLP